MNVSHASRSLVCGAAFAAALVLSSALSAQTVGPNPPAPPTAMPAPTAEAGVTETPVTAPEPRKLTPRRLTPRVTTPSADAPQTPGSVFTAPHGVRVDTLASINPDSVGALSQAEGGFPADLWAGTPRSIVDALLADLPVYTTSAAIRDLMRRLLLSAATVPEGEAAPGTLIAQRIALLAAMGDQPGVIGLLNAMPSRINNADLAWTEANARFLSGDTARACAIVAGYVAETDAPHWQKSFIFCQVLAGQKDQARLSLELLRDMGEQDDVFFKLAGAMIAGTQVTLDSLPDATPLILAMARVASVELPEDVVSSNRPGVLRTIAMNPKLSVDMRLEAAERAAATGALPVSALRQIYASVEFNDLEMANPLTVAENETGPRSRALLYRSAGRQKIPTAKAEAVYRALELAREGGRYGPTARAFTPLIKSIPASAEYVWFAHEAIRAMMIGGEIDGAADWFRVLAANARFRDDSAQLHNRVLPLAYLARLPGTEVWLTENLNSWWQTVKDDEGATAKAEILFTLFQAMGESVSPDLWIKALDGPKKTIIPMPRAALWLRLADAARQNRLGETVLTSLIAMGDGTLADADGVVLNGVLTRLIAVGLPDEACNLAVEAAIAKGL